MILALEILLVVGALAVAAGCLYLVRARQREMYGVEIHDEWLAQDVAFIIELDRAIELSYMRRNMRR